jgi:hypothetical protein
VAPCGTIELTVISVNCKHQKKVKMTEAYPPGLHAVFAADKPFAVVFRRGPSRQVCTFSGTVKKTALPKVNGLKAGSMKGVQIYRLTADT